MSTTHTPETQNAAGLRRASACLRPMTRIRISIVHIGKNIRDGRRDIGHGGCQTRPRDDDDRPLRPGSPGDSACHAEFCRARRMQPIVLRTTSPRRRSPMVHALILEALEAINSEATVTRSTRDHDGAGFALKVSRRSQVQMMAAVTLTIEADPLHAEYAISTPNFCRLILGPRHKHHAPRMPFGRPRSVWIVAEAPA